MTYVIVLVVVLVIIALIILFYSSRLRTRSKIDRHEQEAAGTGDEQPGAVEQDELFLEPTGKEAVAPEKEKGPAPALAEAADQAELGLEEQELELSFEAMGNTSRADLALEPEETRAGPSVDEAELDLLFEELDTTDIGNDALVRAEKGEAEGEQPAVPADSAAADMAEEEIPFILEGEEHLPGKTGDDIVPALEGVDDESGRVAVETPEALEERLDLFFGVGEDIPPEAEEISEVEEKPLERYPADAGGLTPEGYEAELRELEKKLRRELNTAIENRETVSLGLLERKLTTVCGKLSDLQNSFRQKKQLVDDIEEILAELKDLLPGFHVESVRRHLLKGDLEVVRALLNEAVSQLDDTSRLGGRIRYLNGCLAEEQADYATALALYQHASVVDGDNPRYLYAAGRMAHILGNDADARILLEKMLGGEGRLQDGALQALAQHELAKIYAGAKQKEKAEHLLQTAIGGMEVHLGAGHPALGSPLHDLAVLYESSVRYEEAEPLYRRALEVIENGLGENHPHLAATQSRLAGLYEEMELAEKSAPLYEKALQIKIRVLGQEHPDVGTILNHLANLIWQQGRYEQAEPMFIRSLEILEKALGRDHPNLAVVLNNLAELYGEMGDEEKAQQYQERAFALFQLPGEGGDFVEIEKDHDIDVDDEKDQTIAGS